MQAITRKLKRAIGGLVKHIIGIAIHLGKTNAHAAVNVFVSATMCSNLID